MVGFCKRVLHDMLKEVKKNPKFYAYSRSDFDFTNVYTETPSPIIF
jgi:hypothetical protein